MLYLHQLLLQDLSLTRLAEYCKERGYQSLQGNDFSKQALRHILTNDFYVGVSTFGGEKSTGTQPTFITIEFDSIEPTVRIDKILKPVYNFKASE